MGTREAVEAVIVVISLGGFVLYHIWLFLLRGHGSKVNPEYRDFYGAGKLARSIWAEACASDEKDAILGVQQARNAMSACTYLATISVALATAGLTIIFDNTKTDRIYQLALHDPMMKHLQGGLLVSPIAILAAALGCLYCSFISFAQSVRLWVHTGFYVRACTSSFNPGTLTVTEAKRVTIHAGLAFSIGLRLFYLFPLLAMWSVGVTSLLISAVVMTGLIAWMDHFDMPTQEEDNETAEVLQRLTLGYPADGGGNDVNGTRQTVQLSAVAPTALSGATSPLREEGQASNHPQRTATQGGGGRSSGAVPLGQQGRRPSAAQELSPMYVANMV